MNPPILRSTDGGYPLRLRERLREHAPGTIVTLGNLAPLSEHKIALFCSVRSPGDAILGAYDSARKLRDNGLTVISGFHSPVEKECLRILLRGTQPVIICLARAFGKIRIPTDWRRALDSGRLVILTPFEKWPPRPTVESARQRNELLAALADEVLIIHAAPGGQIEEISRLVDRWGMTR
jgi:predicted Rossmann fold nucleotide-binding protein DprA/Smf involved in DNA uptake